ncbi:MAG: VWA domain-containing protein [Vicinamibacterales bacterium]
MFGIDFETLEFGDPRFLWLLAVPAVGLLLWARQLLLHRRDARRLVAARQVPRRERFPRLGNALFSLLMLCAIALTVVALAQPRVVASLVRTGGADIVVLLDGSASMYVRDVDGDRWQRSVRFLRVLGDSLSWQNDRIALSLFAHIATPQVRLTRDPNTFFFFLDHLDEQSPFRLEDDTTWDTNIALGIRWGLRIIEKDEEIRGPSPNARLFVLMSDGQSWSGTVEESLASAKAAGVPVFVVGVGSDVGGIIPDPKRTPLDPNPPVVSRLDRASLRSIAAAGGGEYFELDRGSDVDLANRLIDAARRRAVSSEAEPVLQDVYWQFLAGAAIFVLGAVLFLRDRAALVIQAAAASLALAFLASLL